MMMMMIMMMTMLLRVKRKYRRHMGMPHGVVHRERERKRTGRYAGSSQPLADCCDYWISSYERVCRTHTHSQATPGRCSAQPRLA
jgi:hypothetical protein